MDLRATGIAGVVLLCTACSSGTPATDGGTDAGPLECQPVTGAGTTHAANVTADDVWTEAGNPHVIPSDLSIVAGATLRLSPCAVVRIGGGVTVTVAGSLVAEGTQQRQVVIERRDASTAWASLRAIGGTIRLTNTVVKGGGNPLNIVADLAAALDIRGDQTQPTQGVLLVDGVDVLDSASQGLYLREGGGFFPASNGLRVRGSAGYPIHIWSRSAGTIPVGDYTGNAVDEILLSASAGYEAITEDVTLHDRGVPYHVGHATSAGTLNVGQQGGGLATLTIEAGVTLRFKKGGVLQVDASQGTMPAKGALVAVGTGAKRVIFTSAEPTPAAGDWLGIWFGQTPAASSRLDFARVEFAGGTSASGSNSCSYPGTPAPNNDAAIRVLGPPASAFVTNTVIQDSAHHGIDRGFRSDTKTDFVPTNDFVNVAGCKQTWPKDANGACPTPVPCP